MIKFNQDNPHQLDEKGQTLGMTYESNLLSKNSKRKLFKI